MPQMWKHHAIILAVSTIVFFVNLGGPRLWDRDETRNARCTIEMMERGDWVVPYYNGKVRDIKPVGMYWFMMSAVSLFGPTEFAFRFWSAVAGVGTAFCTYHIGRRLFNSSVGLWGGVILASSLMFAVMARAAKVDSLLILFDTLALTIFVHALFRPRASGEVGPQLRSADHYYPQHYFAVVAMFALMGCAVLGKGPIGFILPTAVIGMFLLVMRLPNNEREDASPWSEPKLAWNIGSIVMLVGWVAFAGLLTKVSREIGVVFSIVLLVHLFYRPLPIFKTFAPAHFLSTCWYMRPITAIVVLAAVALPWHFWVAQRDFSWIEGFYLVNNLGRATSAMESHGGSDLLYYPITIALGFAPWSMFLAPLIIDVARRVRSDDPWRTSYVFAACWVGVYVGMFSLAQTKLPNYIVPCYPALALLAGAFIYQLRHASAKVATWWPQVSMSVLAAVGIGLGIGLPIAAHFLMPGEMWIGVVGLLPLAAAIFCSRLFLQGRTTQATTCFAAFATLFVLISCAGITQVVDRHQHFHVLANAVFRQSKTPEIATYNCLEPSWVHYLGQNLPEIYHDPDAAREFLEQDDDCFIITSDEFWQQLRQELPPSTEIVAECPRFFRDEKLLLIGRTDSIETASQGDESLTR